MPTPGNPDSPADPSVPGGGGGVHPTVDSVAATGATNAECLVPIPSNQLVSENVCFYNILCLIPSEYNAKVWTLEWMPAL